MSYSVYDAIENLLVDEGPQVQWYNYEVIFTDNTHYVVGAKNMVEAVAEAIDSDPIHNEKDIANVIKSVYTCTVESHSCLV